MNGLAQMASGAQKNKNRVEVAAAACFHRWDVKIGATARRVGLTFQRGPSVIATDAEEQ